MSWIRKALAGTGLVLACAAPAAGQRPSLTMLDHLDKGRWELRFRNEKAGVERICLRDARRFIQLRHPLDACGHLIVEDNPMQVTVQYTCRGRGYGRTQIRRETDSLVQIDSQGILDGLPFAFSAEARRVGDCRS